MNKLQELIEKLCPDGVEYKPLWSLTAWDKKFNGIEKEKQKKVISYKYYLSTDFDKVEREDGNIKYISTGISGKDRYTTEELAEEYLAEGEIVCIPWGGTPNVKYHKGKFVTGDNRIATSLDTNILNNKFLYYYMDANIKTIASFYRGSGIKHPSMKNILDMCIPVPPLEVQNEIVRILDDLTLLSKELSEELLAELKARKKQYEYYREKLLDKGKNVEWVPLLSISDTYTGLTYKPSDVASQGTLVLRSSNIKENRLVFEDNVYVKIDNIPERTIVKKDDILICVRNGSKALIGKAAMIPKHEEKMAFGAFMTILRPSNKVIPKYLFYVWQSPRIQDMIHNDSGMPINQITKKMLEDIKVPLTSLQEQEEIVKILDIIDKLCMEITKIIPIEIENRQKQYEYYRDRLLTFKELKVNE